MVVIKHGTAYEELDSYVCAICPKCGCKFECVKSDVHSYLNEECYVICPECVSDIKLPNVSAVDIVECPEYPYP